MRGFTTLLWISFLTLLSRTADASLPKYVEKNISKDNVKMIAAGTGTCGVRDAAVGEGTGTCGSRTAALTGNAIPIADSQLNAALQQLDRRNLNEIRALLKHTQTVEQKQMVLDRISEIIGE